MINWNLDPVWQDNTNAFLKMMVLDRCFILEILRMDTSGYAPNDPLFNKHGHLSMLPFLRQEMLLLENQVPLLVLLKLLAVENKISRIEVSCPLSLAWFPGNTYAHSQVLFSWYTSKITGQSLALIRCVSKEPSLQRPRRSLERSRFKPSHGDAYCLIPSARKLQDAGIRFKKRKFANLRDISSHARHLGFLSTSWT
ncbi:uncharacterized protein LOC105156790 [Sesamum indicum]|uniref:Uncharacterized protein LOC105156790 n=1 Tax=Sesamum indicum TaxID=4182 RepID=A0A8M8UMW0_SESIN|nr:uncharacterized protein LOC105156790 [Sesamum indicum]